ncbi:MAG: hypothetical protein AAB448_03175 [Patescibacteria group bacterium]
MMLCIDGSDVESVFFALVKREGETLRVIHTQQVPRRLGDELRLVQEFLLAHACEQADVEAVGLVIGPGSSGALRSTLSLFDAWALGRSIEMYEVVRLPPVLSGRRPGGGSGEVGKLGRWEVRGSAKPFVLPVYERAAHTTPSHKDALGRRTSV